MKLTKQIKTDLAKAYQCAMEISILDMKAPLRYINQYIAENVSGYGTAADEKVQSREDYRKMVMAGRRQSKGKLINAKIITPYRPKLIDDTTVQFRDEIVVQIGDKKNKQSLHLWFSTLFKYQHNKWQLAMFHGSIPDAASSIEDTFHIGEAEKKLKQLEQVVAQRTAALQTKTRELAIEASLERVRAVAMGMKKADDMLSICETISQQLAKLGIKEIRNVQTAIFYETRGTYMNFEYYTKHDRTFITEVDFKNHKLQLVFAKKMMKGPNEEVLEHLKGKKLQDWYTYQKTTNQFADKYLLKAHSLNYYWYSLGPVALGTSTYYPLTKEETDLFKRFLKVFELAYRRYIDIEKAEAQAREAQIEAALERIRARALAMHQSEEFSDVARVMREQMGYLGQPELETSAVHLYDEDADTIFSWRAFRLSSKLKGNISFGFFKIPKTSCAIAREFVQKFKSNATDYTIEVSGAKQTDWYKILFKLAPEVQDAMRKSGTTKEKRYYHFSKFTGGALLMVSSKEPANDVVELQKRSAQVFDLAYRRFKDLQKAEAQAREAQIETSLERIRAASLAMKDSATLGGIIYKLYGELTKLDAKLDRCFIMIVNPENKGITWWMAGQEGLLAENGFFIQMNQHASHLWYLDCWKKRRKKWQYLLEGKEKRDWDRFGFSKTELARLPEFIKKFMAGVNKINLTGSSDQFGSLVTGSFEPLPDEQQEIISRFTIAFNQAYIRFLDLQKAEAQAREALIEAALERVRSRSMAMHTSQELKEVALELRKQMGLLGQKDLEVCAIHLYDDKNSFESWSAMKAPGSESEIIQTQARFPNKGIRIVDELMKYYSKGSRDYVLVNEGEKMVEWFKVIKAHAPELHASIMQSIGKMPVKKLKANWSVADFSGGALVMVTYGEPDMQSSNLLRRSANVFEQAYIRFLDLQKAEAQAKEAQIELALERVRARTMAMQNSEELLETVAVMFEQFKALGEEPERMAIEIVNEKEHVFDIWATQHGGSQLNSLAKISLDEPHVMQKMYKAWKAKTRSITIDLQGKELNDYFNFLKKAGLPVQRKIFGKRRVQNVATFSKGILTIITPEPRPQETIQLLERFASVFDGTYTRFLDLQKAEAQAREAEIELALERVRARTMAMQQSDELPEAANLLFLQMQSLGMPAWSAGYCIWGEDKKSVTLWMSSEGVLQPPFQAPTTEDELFIEMRKGHEKGKALHVVEMGGKKLEAHYKYMRTLPVVGEIFDSILEAGHPLPTFQVMHYAYFSRGYLLFITYEPVPDAHDIFKRFSNVFDQTYTRFLDLKKAEAQAREAQIEMALERVRSRSLAMHSSGELGEVVTVVLNNLVELGYIIDQGSAAHLTIFSEGTKDFVQWSADPALPHPVRTFIPYTDLPILTEFWDARQKGHDFFAKVYSFDEKNTWFNFAFEHSDLKHIPGELKKLLLESETYAHSIAIEKHSAIIINSITGNQLSENQIDILRRFSKVFEQAYVRFLDLQKAEAQAREAQIEAALERVRSRSMAMHKSDELLEAGEILFSEMQKLDIESLTAGYVLLDEEGKNGSNYTPNPLTKKILPLPVIIPHNETVHMKRVVENWKKGNPFFVVEMDEDETIKHQTFIAERSTNFPLNAAQLIAISPAKLFLHNFYFKEGYLLIVGGNRLSAEQTDIMLRFTKVFQQTYTRFLDLQRAEAQAREAQIEAALERIRGKVTSMQESTELLDIVVSMRHEFVSLGHQADYFWYMRWLPEIYEKAMTSGDGTRIGMVMTLPRHIHGEIKLVADWEKGDEPSVVLAMDVDTAVDYVDKMIRLGDFTQVDHNAPTLDDIRHIGGLTFVMARTTHGEIGYSLAGVVPNPPAEDVATLVRFAGVFDLAYRRFEDLKHAEARNREVQIELALERVRSRSMAMHKSEELKEVIQVVVEQFGQLNIQVEHAGFIMDYKERDDMHIWLADPRKVPSELNIPYFDSPHWNSFIEAKKQGLDFFTNHLSFEVKNRFYQDLFTLFPVPEETRNYYLTCSGLAISTVLLDNIGLYIENFSGTPYNEEENKILIRFGKVFQQTYTRFLDLKKAEAQAREAQIEAAMEKVRSRSLAMQKPGELTEVAELLRKEMGQLGVEELETSSIYIVDKEKKQAECRYAIKDIREENKQLVSDEMTITFADTWVGTEMGKFYRAKKEHTSIVMKGDNRKEWINYCAGKSNVLQGYYGDEIPERTYHLVKFNGGYMGAASPGNISTESWDLLRRAASVFSLAYTRFNDLQIAEAHALQAEQDLIAIKEAKQKAEEALTELQATQKQLIQAEKMASLGELTAGIAHEIQNPLNFVNNFSEVSKELLDEMKVAIEKGDTEDAKDIMNDVIQNLEKINHHGKRADGIVKGMLQHSSSGSGKKEPTDINALADEYLRLAYHGLRAKDKSFNATMKTDFDESIGNINIIPQDIGRVILNLITNAFYVVAEKKTLRQAQGDSYEPTVEVSTKKEKDKIEIKVKDNGNGIPQKILDKIFQPFFTTKPTGQGTGLGLSLSYDIVKAHGGEIEVNTKENKGTEFTIKLPIV
jgi:signal transduction histidine kinase